MIVIDTNVISELMKESPAKEVISWIDQQDITQLFITSITVAEILYGINALPQGRKKNALEEAFNKTLKEAFKHRILFFDEASAHQYGKLMGQRKTLSRPLSILDGQIAAIVLTQGASLATRNIKDFKDCNLTLINPFK